MTQYEQLKALFDENKVNYVDHVIYGNSEFDFNQPYNCLWLDTGYIMFDLNDNVHEIVHGY